MLLPVLEFLNSVLELLVSLLVRYSSQTLGLGAGFLPVPLSFPPGFLFLLQLELSWETCKLKKKGICLCLSTCHTYAGATVNQKRVSGPLQLEL